MTSTFSIYLDVVRFVAAVLVMLTHYTQHNIVDRDMAMKIPDLGREAVIIFFVLSGYVIAHTVANKKQTLAQYVVARAARIYSVALPLILMAFVAAFLIEVFSETELTTHYQIVRAYFYMPFHWLFLGEIWNLSETPPLLAAYWSLGYEVWYYILFAILYFGRGYTRILLALLVFLFMGHKLWLLFPIWMSGILLYYIHHRLKIGSLLAAMGWGLSFVCLYFYKSADIETQLRALGIGIWPFGFLSLGSADRYLGDFVVCLIVFQNFLFAKYITFNFSVGIIYWIRIFSSYTFTLYLGHALVIAVLKEIYDNNPSSYIDVGFITLAIGVFTYLVGQVTERRKEAFATFFAQLYNLIVNRKWSANK